MMKLSNHIRKVLPPATTAAAMALDVAVLISVD
jgi:hypothetical protein